MKQKQPINPVFLILLFAFAAMILSVPLVIMHLYPDQVLDFFIKLIPAVR